MSKRNPTFKGGFSVSLPMSRVGAAVDYRSLTLHQEIDRHDLAVVHARSRRAGYFDTMYPGSPVQITYSNQSGGRGVFLGYIAKVEPLETIDGNMYQRNLVCVAASREFRATGQATWRGMTGPEIVQDIGRRLGFKVITKQHGLRRKQVVQGGDTYWETLTKLSKMTGYVLRAEGTTLYFLPLKDMVAAFASVAPVMATTAGSGSRLAIVEVAASLGNTSDDGDDLADAAVVVSLGPNDKSESVSREVPSSVLRRYKASTPTYEKFSSSMVAHSRADAVLLAKGMADRGMMAYDARVVSRGDPFISPYRPVYLATADRTTRGWWIVKKVEHCITLGEYTCTSIVSTDEVSSQRAEPPVQRYRDISQELQQGWSPFTASGSRLRNLSPGFVVGQTYRPDGKIAQWVSV